MIPYENSFGKATFTIDSFTKVKLGWNYKGTLCTFVAEDNSLVAKKLPCRVYSETFYEPSFEYSCLALLKYKEGRGYVTLKPKGPWEASKTHFSLAHPRFQLKKKIQQFLYKHITEKKSAAFLISLLTGDAEDDIQRYVFAKLGLAHLFAVSGFHFALFAFAFHFFLRLFLKRKVEAVVLLVILTLFFLFIGCAASVERAWFTSLFSLFSILVEKERKSLNTFGLALLCVLLTNPLFIKDLGFQLSFLATSGILLFFNQSDHVLQKLIPKKPFEEMKTKSVLTQGLYIVSLIFRKAMALNIAVHIPLFPILLATFHKFPFHSLIYNLFFPFLVSLSLFALLFSLPLYFLWAPLGNFGFHLVTLYTTTILKIPEFSPFPLKTLYVESLFTGFTTLSLNTIFLLGILFQNYLERKKRLGEFNLLFY